MHHDRSARDAVAGDGVTGLRDERRADRRLGDRGERGGVRDLRESDRCADGRELSDRCPARDEDEVRGLGGGKRRVARVRGGVDDRDLSTAVPRGLEDRAKPRGLGAEVAAATRSDEERGTAWVVARSGPLSPDGLRAVYAIIEAQKLVDLFVLERAELDSPSPKYMYCLVCVDVARRSEEHGLSAAPFPQHNLHRSVDASLEADRRVGRFEKVTAPDGSHGPKVGVETVEKVTSG